MAVVNLRIDPDGTVLNLGDRSAGWSLMGLDAPTPDLDSQWASSADTEGARRASTRPVNRTITARIMIEKSSDALLEAEENKLGQKVGKLQRDGGELELTVPSGTVLTYTVEEANYQRQWDPASAARHRAFYEVTFICQPYGLGTEQDLGDNTETTLPVLIFSDTIPGDVDADGRTVIDDDSANDQWFAVWGVEDDALYTHTTSSGSGALFYEAESRTALGGAAATAVATASGGTVVRQGTLTPTYQAMLSTQASGGGSHLSHAGIFNVWARMLMPTTNTGEVSVGFEYAQGDFRKKTTVGEVTFEANHGREGQWIFQRLGQINIQKVATGTHRWEGRIIAKSTVPGDDLDVDWIGFWPTRAYGEASGIDSLFTPTSLSARDEFVGTTSGNALNARSAPVGGSWATSGAATDLVFADSITIGSTTLASVEAITRSASGARYAVLGTTNYTDVQVSVQYALATGDDIAGVFARWTDSSNHVLGRVHGDGLVQLVTVVSGTESVLNSGTVSQVVALRDLVLVVYASGRAVLMVKSETGSILERITGSSSVLATGGTLATGEPGIVDNRDPNGTGRFYTNFAVSVPPADAAIFASQSLELRHDSALREDSTGSYWNRVSSTRGDYLRVPPAGQEGRSTRTIIKACRYDPDTMSDPAIDDISARQHVTPRYLQVPD